jgi:hypothetical protein
MTFDRAGFPFATQGFALYESSHIIFHLADISAFEPFASPQLLMY